MTAKERLIEAYAKLVYDGKATINQVPRRYRDAVATRVAEMMEEGVQKLSSTVIVIAWPNYVITKKQRITTRDRSYPGPFYVQRSKDGDKEDKH